MTGVKIEVDDSNVQTTLDGLVRFGGDATGALKAIGARLVANTLMRFEQGRGPSSVPWKRSQRAEKQNGQTLIESGRLRTSITWRMPTPLSLEVGTNVAYAAIHQFGGTIQQAARGGTLRFQGNRFAKQRRRKDGTVAPPTKKQRDQQVQFKARTITMPARPFLGFDDQDSADTLAIITRHLRAVIDARGARP